MAYNYQPNPSQVGKVSFANVLNQRLGSTAVDVNLTNCFLETIKDGNGSVANEYIVSRPGLRWESTAVGTGFNPRGIKYWNGHLYTVVGNQLAQDGVAIYTLPTSGLDIGWVEFINSTNQIFLIMLDGIGGYQIDSSGTVTQITSANFPTPHCVRAVFIDGYLVIAKQGTGDIYNSDINNPLGWTAGNFISAEMHPDPINGLMKQSNYIVAFGTQTIEYFYNAGNSPGTPFARNPSAYHKLGSLSYLALADHEDDIYFFGNTNVGVASIFVLQGFRAIDIGTHAIRRMIDDNAMSIQSAFVIRIKGHAFYVLNLTALTMVYDIDENVWHYWATADGNGRFPIDVVTYNDQVGYSFGMSLFSAPTNVAVLSIHKDLGTDTITSGGAATPITMTAITPKFDFGNMNRKFANRLTFVTDIPTTPGNASVNVSWSDDDYRTWTAPRNIVINDLMTTTAQMGWFRRRAWKFTYSSPYPFRFEGAELTYTQGTA